MFNKIILITSVAVLIGIGVIWGYVGSHTAPTPSCFPGADGNPAIWGQPGHPVNPPFSC